MYIKRYIECLYINIYKKKIYIYTVFFNFSPKKCNNYCHCLNGAPLVPVFIWKFLSKSIFHQQKVIFLQTYLARGTFSRSTLTRNCYYLYHLPLANSTCRVFLQHFSLVCKLSFISCNPFVECMTGNCHALTALHVCSSRHLTCWKFCYPFLLQKMPTPPFSVGCRNWHHATCYGGCPLGFLRNIVAEHMVSPLQKGAHGLHCQAICLANLDVIRCAFP